MSEQQQQQQQQQNELEAINSLMGLSGNLPAGTGSDQVEIHAMEIDSPSSDGAIVPDSVDEEDNTITISTPDISLNTTSTTTSTSVKKEDSDEMIIDIIGGGGGESTPEDYTPLRLQPLPISSRVISKRKSGRGGRGSRGNTGSPLANSIDNSPVGSPPPTAGSSSGLTYEIKNLGGSSRDEEEEEEGVKSEASTSTLSPKGEEEEEETIVEPLKPTLLPSNIKLSSTFISYTPPQGGSDTDEDLNEERNNGGAGGGGGEKEVLRRKGKGRVKEVDALVEEEGDDRLYCVCQKLYEPERMMIACDLCENWYHLNCIDISDVKVELVDQFVCPLCHTASIHTTWKAQCARPTCPKSVVPLSKYCSDYCGIEVAATRLELAGYDPERFWSKVVGSRRREGMVLDLDEKILVEEGEKNKEEEDGMEGVVEENGKEAVVVVGRISEEALKKQAEVEEEEDTKTLQCLQVKLSEMLLRRQKLDQKVEFIDARLLYLTIAIRRWEAICQATADGIAASEPTTTSSSSGGGGTNTKKPSGKKGATIVSATMAPHAQCGLDVRLVYDDSQWDTWVQSEEGRNVLEGGEGGDEGGDFEGVCLRPKKKCERHTGWQKVREADFEVEKAVLIRRIDRLAAQERSLRVHIEDHEEATRFRSQNRFKTGLALDVTGKMAMDYEPSRVIKSSPASLKRRRAVGGIAGGLLVKGHAVNLAAMIPNVAPTTSTATSSNNGSVSGAGGGGVVGGGDDNHYDVPDEVFAFLSRSEQQKLRGSRR